MSLPLNQLLALFHPLTHISTEDLPLKFTYPFHYEAHNLCKIAAGELQKKLQEWQWNKNQQGKMFGVLIVENYNGDYGFLCAYSGNKAAILNSDYFVPPIFDLLDPNSFFVKGESELTAINEKIKQLTISKALKDATSHLDLMQAEMKASLLIQKKKNKEAKQKRKAQRESAREKLSTSEYARLEKNLISISQSEKSALKRIKQDYTSKIQKIKSHLEVLLQEISILKERRQRKSAALQQRLFDQYQLLNSKGEVKSLCDIFQESINKMPPAAAGDCAAPRLLQYAYTHHMKPLAMAEFWWGKSPISEIRKEGHYYPACRGKCEPILGHMLQGLEIDTNPLKNQTEVDIEIIFEDADILLINKPSDLLSVPGKSKQTCVVDLLKKQRADLENILVIHRLDMATSGLLLLAKNKESYKVLQEQFINRKVKKRYEAILAGVITEDEGRIELPLRVDLNNRPQQLVCYDHGKAALTIWKVIERTDKNTRIAFFPITGRTHQLRVHAAHQDGLNTPIVGDELYGSKADRLLLHARSIEFSHPTSGKKLRFSSPPKF